MAKGLGPIASLQLLFTVELSRLSEPSTSNSRAFLLLFPLLLAHLAKKVTSSSNLFIAASFLTVPLVVAGTEGASGQGS